MFYDHQTVHFIIYVYLAFQKVQSIQHVGRQSKELAIVNLKLEVMVQALTTMNVKTIAMKTAIANISSTAQVLKVMANKFA